MLLVHRTLGHKATTVSNPTLELSKEFVETLHCYANI